MGPGVLDRIISLFYCYYYLRVLSRIRENFKTQIFATDIDVSAIETACKGLYPASISEDVGA